MSDNNRVYVSYGDATSKPKKIIELEKLIAMLEAEDDESVKDLIEKKAEKIRELEAKYDFAQLVILDNENGHSVQFTFHENEQRYYVEGDLYEVESVESNDSGITVERTALGIIQMSDEQQNAKGIKNGSILLNEIKVKEKIKDTFVFGNNTRTWTITKDMIAAVLQTVDDEVVTISKTFNRE